MCSVSSTQALVTPRACSFVTASDSATSRGPGPASRAAANQAPDGDDDQQARDQGELVRPLEHAGASRRVGLAHVVGLASRLDVPEPPSSVAEGCFGAPPSGRCDVAPRRPDVSAPPTWWRATGRSGETRLGQIGPGHRRAGVGDVGAGRRRNRGAGRGSAGRRGAGEGGDGGGGTARGGGDGDGGDGSGSGGKGSVMPSPYPPGRLQAAHGRPWSLVDADPAAGRGVAAARRWSGSWSPAARPRRTGCHSTVCRSGSASGPHRDGGTGPNSSTEGVPKRGGEVGDAGVAADEQRGAGHERGELAQVGAPGEHGSRRQPGAAATAAASARSSGAAGDHDAARRRPPRGGEPGPARGGPAPRAGRPRPGAGRRSAPRPAPGGVGAAARAASRRRSSGRQTRPAPARERGVVSSRHQRSTSCSPLVPAAARDAGTAGRRRRAVGAAGRASSSRWLCGPAAVQVDREVRRRAPAPGGGPRGRRWARRRRRRRTARSSGASGRGGGEHAAAGRG